MTAPFNVLQIGLGSIGKTIAQTIIKRDNLELIAAIDTDPGLINQPIAALLSMSSESQVIVQDDLQKVLSELSGQSADVALVLTSSSLEKIVPTISACLEAGLHVLSLCEELSFPFAHHPKIAQELDQLARDANKTILGTGINPGFLMDLLPIVLTAPCQRVESIHVTRCMNSSHRRASFQKKIGTGMTQDDFSKAIADGTITGHVGLVESIQMINAALELKLDHIEELPPEAVLASTETTTPFATVSKNDVLGLKSRAIGSKNGKNLVILDFIAYAEASPEYDEIRIEGLPNVSQVIEGGMQGDHGTVGMVVNLIPQVVQAPPGLLTMKDIPCPHNTQYIWK
ncbi:MAG: NAD(P)H-dependent amine dehydrogenase family protein [Candidatus Hodarchaeales archaeon]|jgi:4-hydroxy-tetrahydrodipicolinate reductase